jgi:hypothetical protein
MPRPKKTYKIKRSYPRVTKQVEESESSGESSDEEIKAEREVPEVQYASTQNFKEETPIKRAVKMDPRNISNLSEE